MRNSLILSIGINDYDSDKIDNLNNAVNDAKEFADKMRELGNDVFDAYNIGIDDFDNIFDKFIKALPNYSAGVFYFAGHGMEQDGSNYLITKDSPVTPEGKLVVRYCIDLKNCVRKMAETPCDTTITIVDACRNNPFTGLIRGDYVYNVAPMLLPKGSIIAFSTSPGEKAKDDHAAFPGHSVYTGSLLHHLNEEGLEIEQLFKKVRTEVHNLTNKIQTPWEHTSLIGQFVFNTGIRKISEVLPYTETAIKDLYWHNDKYDEIFKNLRTSEWPLQEYAIHKFLEIEDTIEPDVLFVIGRNITQCVEGNCFAAIHLFDSPKTIMKYTQSDGVNHLLNGILFEIYFNRKGEFRYTQIKGNVLKYLTPFFGIEAFKNSFDFIENILTPYHQYLLFIPRYVPAPSEIQVNIERMKPESAIFALANEVNVIKSINFGTNDLLTEETINQIKYGDTQFSSLQHLKNYICELYCVPEKYLIIKSNDLSNDMNSMILDTKRFKRKLI